MSPTPSIPHGRVSEALAKPLRAAAPSTIEVWTSPIGVSNTSGSTYVIPDITVMRSEATKSHGRELDPGDVLLVVEVLSPSNRGQDLVLKRPAYAAMGIPDYWIVDPMARVITVLRIEPGGADYSVVAEVAPGTSYRTDRPLDLVVDTRAVW